MAQYKVPQDVEADDKLLGPFNFRQFVYLLVAGGLIALSVALFQLFPLLAIVPLPFILLLGALALPLKKDQPMETYLAAIVSYYLKPRTRRWMTGQSETTITITAPKQTEEEVRVRDITGEEATHRLSFLANIMDTEGYAIKGVDASRVNNELVREANMATDMFETEHYENLEDTLTADENARHEKAMQEMRSAMASGASGTAPVATSSTTTNEPANFGSSVVVAPGSAVATGPVEKSNMVQKDNNYSQIVTKPSIIELANNSDYSIATISKEANRLKERDEGEVFVSLH